MLHKGKLKKRGEKSSSGRSPSTFTNKYLNWIPHPNKKMLHSKSTYFYRWTYIVPSICSLPLLVGGIVMINPMQSNQASAIPVDTDSGDGNSGNTETDTTPSISLAIEGATNQTTNVTAGEVAYRTNIFKVSANHFKDFYITLSSMNGYGSELHGKDNPTATINDVGANVTPDNFGNNTWGYGVTEDLTNDSEKSLKYNSVPEYSSGAQTITSYKYTDESEWLTTKNYKLAFAAKIGGDSPADHYVTQVALSVVGTPGNISELPINTMQEMTAKICESIPIGTTDRLEDVRDRINGIVGTGTKYWVARLKDGNCWMTQNLDYNVPGDGRLYAESSNITQDVKLNDITIITNDTEDGFSVWPTENSLALSYYDPGKMLHRDPNTTSYCDGAGIKLNQLECINVGWLDVSVGYTPKNSAPQGDTMFNTSATDEVLNGTIYDAHYLSGNYYSWNLATAGTGEATEDVQGVQAAGSICPKGWKLPTSGDSISQYPILSAGNLNSYDVSGSFAYLLRQYGLAKSLSDGNTDTEDYTIYNAPLYYLGTGNVSSAMTYVGNTGYYWSSVAHGGKQTFGGAATVNAFLFRKNSFVWAADNRPAYAGYTIRCVNDPSI